MLYSHHLFYLMSYKFPLRHVRPDHARNEALAIFNRISVGGGTSLLVHTAQSGTGGIGIPPFRLAPVIPPLTLTILSFTFVFNPPSCSLPHVHTGLPENRTSQR